MPVSLATRGKTWLRSLKVIELEHFPDGSIRTIQGQP